MFRIRSRPDTHRGAPPGGRIGIDRGRQGAPEATPLSRLAPLALLAGLVAAGCSHDAPEFQLGPNDPPEPGTEEAASSLAEATTPPEESREFLAQLRLAGQAAATGGGAAIALAGPEAALDIRSELPAGTPWLRSAAAGSAATSGPPAALAAARRVLAASAAAGSESALPSELLGATLVWDPEVDGYVVDPSLEGAPSDGVRILLYRPDGSAGRPAEPLEEVGYADLRDGSAEGSIHLELRAVLTEGESPMVLLDYHVEATAEQSGDRLEISFASEGFLAGADDRLEFSLSQYLDLGETSITFASSNEISVPGRGIYVSLEFEGEGTETTGTASMRLEIRNAGETVVLEMEGVDESVEGRIVRNGETVVLIEGAGSDPTFTRPDGTPLAGDALDPLEEIVTGIDEVFSLTDEVFAPLDPLILFQVEGI